jgi:hypothetical protein
MSSEFESINTGIAAHIGKYADAVRIPAGAEVATQAWHNVEDALSLRRCGADRHRQLAAVADRRR